MPCYNSQDYMGRCIESLLPGGDEVEILIIDDGSTDLTGDMADKYQEKYPGIIRAIHQENGGHGEAVNTGIKNATGLYFKVVDSDDRVDANAYRQVLDKLRDLTGGDTVLDMMLCNFVYDKDTKSMIPNTREVKEVKVNDYTGQNTIRYDMIRMFIDILDSIEDPKVLTMGQNITLNTLKAYELIKDINEESNE